MGSTISSDTKEWKAQQDAMQSRRKICENVMDRIKATKDDQELNTKILTTISKYDFREAYQDVLTKTGVGKRYDDRCAWFINDERFNDWAAMGKDAILLLEGSKGTGKTIVMARAISEILHSDEVQFHDKKFAMFFFQKNEGDSSLLTAKGCLQNLVRQLSWDRTTASVEKTTEAMYERFMKQVRGDTIWAIEECLELLKELIPANETYIMIDGLDECKDSVELLQKLSDLTFYMQGTAGDRQPLHMMLCGRQDLKISEYFTKCVSILTTPARTQDDQDHYVKTEIAYRRKLRSGSLFFKSLDYTSRLERLLLKQGNGLFRWTEMLIDVFEKRRFENTDDIEDLFKELLQPADRKEMNDEYARLLNTLGQTNRRRAIKMLKLLACQGTVSSLHQPEANIGPLTLNNLVEAINASDAAGDYSKRTAEEVSSILAGFVTVEFASEFVRLTHASVFDFLTSDQAPDDDFSCEGLHSEAVRLCLSSISYQTRSGFFMYSCTNWQYHCKKAISDSQKPAAQDLKKPVKAFWFGDHWRTWFATMKGIWTHEIRGIECPRRTMGYLIAKYDLIELLDPGFDDERPYFRELINLSDTTEDSFTVLELAMHENNVSTVQKLLQLFPGHVAAINMEECLFAACMTRVPEVVETFLGIGASIFTWYGGIPAFHFGCHYKSPPSSHGAWVTKEVQVRSKPRLSNHKTQRINVRQRIFIQRAHELDACGFSGSVQRLLRMRDLNTGRRIHSLAYPEVRLELESLLERTTQRDSQVLYEFGSPNIPDDTFIPSGSLADTMNENREWLLARYKVLDAQYNEMKRAVEERQGAYKVARCTEI